jgi:hypothetical protein
MVTALSTLSRASQASFDDDAYFALNKTAFDISSPPTLPNADRSDDEDH